VVADLGAYIAAKGAIVAMTKVSRSSSPTTASRSTRSRPGAIDTPLNKTAYTPEVRRTYEQRIGLHRLGTPEEVADATLFLASDASRYVTGPGDRGRRRPDHQRLGGARAGLMDARVLVDGLDHPRGSRTTPARRSSGPAARTGSSTASIPARGRSTEVARAPGFVLGLAVDGRGRVIVCASSDGSLCAYDGAQVRRVVEGLGFPNWPAFAPTGRCS
jgi:hypothetical protein